MTVTPVEHLQEAQKLTADALVDLFSFTLKNDPVEYLFTEDRDITWQGKTYEGLPCKLTGDSQSADGEESRPLFRIMNPLGIFNVPAMEGKLDNAIVIRKQVLLRHIENNVNIFQQRMWYIGRIRELAAGQSITFELRNMTEGANFQLPYRQYLPPEFPMVSL